MKHRIRIYVSLKDKKNGFKNKTREFLVPVLNPVAVVNLGLTTTATGAVDKQDTGGNWAAVGRKTKWKCMRRQREKRKAKSVGVRVRVLNEDRQS